MFRVKERVLKLLLDIRESINERKCTLLNRSKY